ncbi:MAG: nuclear transport factor 2 (NTF2) superfamily protein [Rubritalea sp.]|jgi:nuclear transport factor 2 (NTF2) superfamily protein
MKSITLETRPPLPPFTAESARAKVQAAEDAWNTCDPQKVSMAYTKDTEWRNRTECINGRTEVRNFLERKWKKELNYRLRKTLWSYTDNRISVKFVYEYQDATGQWFRAYGNEQWEFSANGLMQKREASINDMVIDKPSIVRH